MKFSEYIVIENTGGSVDPLGFLRPSSALGDNLFKQFTVLSAHPAYHGFLAYTFGRLAKDKVQPHIAAFASRFRDIEILWGIINGRAKVPILNMTKYASFVDLDDFRLSQARRRGILYAKPAYGTLGHYSSPSASWGILEVDRSGLTPLGQRLAKAWMQRDRHDFDDLLSAWEEDLPMGEMDALPAAVERFPLAAAPSPEEQQVWRQLIERYCERHPAVAPLWTRPLPVTVQNLAGSEVTYAGYFPGIAEHYASEPVIRARVDLAWRFELLAAVTQFIFEWEYVRRLGQVREVGLDAPALAKAVAAIAVERSQAYISTSGFRDAGTLFQRLAGCQGYDQVAATVLDHHAVHQRAKGATPFIVGSDVAVLDRVDTARFADFLTLVKDEPESLEPRLHWRHKRGWNFDRARRWLDYAGGVQ